MNRAIGKKKFIRIAKATFILSLSLLVALFSVFIKVLAAVTEQTINNDNSKAHPYVLDTNGDEIIDDNTTYVYDFDDKINLKDPL